MTCNTRNYVAVIFISFFLLCFVLFLLLRTYSMRLDAALHSFRPIYIYIRGVWGYNIVFLSFSLQVGGGAFYGATRHTRSGVLDGIGV